VDEYQDSNGVQDAIFTALTAEKQNCFMVGDVKQSIYQFRLADPGIFLEKYRDYVPAEEAQTGQGRKIMLSRNFRSGGEVIEAVNDIFFRCMTPKVGGLRYGQSEALREGIPHKELPGPAVELHALQARNESYPEEAAYVAQQIRRMIDEKVLIRSGDGFLFCRGDRHLRDLIEDIPLTMLRKFLPGIGGRPSALIIGICHDQHTLGPGGGNISLPQLFSQASRLSRNTSAPRITAASSSPRKAMVIRSEKGGMRVADRSPISSS
jgi:hypothetical protein